MFGWSIIASACRSASKRAITCLVSIPSLMIFSATRRRTGSLLLGHPDHAEAAFADPLEELVRADLVAGLLGERVLPADPGRAPQWDRTDARGNVERGGDRVNRPVRGGGHETARRIVSGQEGFHAGAQSRVRCRTARQKCGPLGEAR